MQRPPLSVLQRAVGWQRDERRERLQLQRLGVGEHLRVAAEVGVLRRRVVGVPLDEQRLAQPVRHPAQRVADADLERRGGVRVLTHLNQPFTPAQARVAHIGVRPQHDAAHGQQRVGVRSVRLLGDERDPAGAHHAQRPRRQPRLPQVAIHQPMAHLHRVGIGRDHDLFLDARSWLGRLAQQELLPIPVPLDGVVVGDVGTNRMLRRVPEPMSAVDAPSICALQGRRLRPEQILAARPPEVQDSDAELQGDEQLVGVADKAQAGMPRFTIHDG